MVISVYPLGKVQIQAMIKNTGTENWKYAVGVSIGIEGQAWIDFPFGYKSYDAGRTAMFGHTITIPAGTPPGDYRVAVGVYERLSDGSAINELDFHITGVEIKVL